MRKEVRIVRRLARGRVFKKEGNGRRIEVFYLHDEKERQALNSSVIVSESEGGNVNLATDQNENNDITKRRKENKEELGSSSTPSIGARILRALSKTRDDKISNSKEKDDVIFARNRGELDVFEIEKDDEEAGGVNDEFVSVNKEGNNNNNNNNNNNGERELKRKRRRRPRLMDLRAQDEALGLKIDDDDIYGGRPMVWLGEGSQLYVDMHGANIHIHNTKERVKEEEGFNNEIVLAAEIRTKRFARRLIMKQLLAAGWKVDHRIPATNIGSDHHHHHDVVYVSPEGKTHSSIALAYSRLKRHYEAGDGERKVYRPRFKLAPVPQMLVNNVLTHQEVGGSSAANPDFTSPYKMPVQMRDDKKRRKRYKRKCVPYYGKRTVLSWMIDMGTIRENEPVYYMDKSVLLEGMIARGGMHCGCCNEIVSISEFEAHSRHTTKTNDLPNPLRNICTERGASLLQCMLESWYKLDISKRQSFRFINNRGQDSHDDACLVCGELGDVVCCDSCPSVFHRSCLDMQEVPSGEWHCTYCCCKFCGLLSRNTNLIGSSTNHFIEPSLFTCRYCERKYHKSCLEANCSKIIVHSRDAIFCGNRCQEICERLENILGIKHYIEEGLSWSFIYGTDVDWHMKPHMVECNSKLAVALSLMDECFRQHIDHRTGINVIHNVLYNIGSNFERLNFERFFTAILEKGDDIICVASIRIHPNRLAEMPYIGTRYTYRRQGMCRRFLKAIEWALRYLNVDLLVIPAIAELRNTWITAFGFEPLALETKQIIKNMNLMKFSGVEVLQKKISDHNFSYENLIPAQVSNDLQKNRGVDMEANVNCDGAENIIYLSD